MSVDDFAVHRARAVVILGASVRDGTGVAWILRALLTVHECRHVPGFLLAQHAATPARHVGSDECRGVGDAAHAGAPVKRFRPPQSWEIRLPVPRYAAFAVAAVAQSAVLRIDLCTALVVRG